MRARRSSPGVPCSTMQRESLARYLWQAALNCRGRQLRSRTYAGLHAMPCADHVAYAIQNTAIVNNALANPKDRDVGLRYMEALVIEVQQLNLTSLSTVGV